MANVHPSYFIAELKIRFGKMPIKYGVDIKADKAKGYLKGIDLSIRRISELLFFAVPKCFFEIL